MGQQQLFIVILVVIITGLAIVFGIRTFSSQATSLIYDEYNELALETLERAYVLSKEPVGLGGGGGTFDASWFNFNHIPCPFDMWENSSAICHTEGESGNYSRMTLVGNTDHGEMEFYVVSKVNPADAHRPVSGAFGYIIRYRVDSEGISVMNPKIRREY